MKLIEENETEIYIEVEQNEFPLTINRPGKKLFVRMAKTESSIGADIRDMMEYHPWDETKIQKGVLVREALSRALEVIHQNVPPSADRSTAVRKIREARMDCNSAITHDGKY